MRQKSNPQPYLIIAILIIVIIILYLGTVGNVDGENLRQIPDEFKERREAALRRHSRLKALISKQEDAHQRLSKVFKRTYFYVRLGFVVLWGLILFFLMNINLVKDIGDAMNYSEAMILVCIVLNFLTFGTISNAKGFIQLIRKRLENWIWGKHVNIDEKIKKNYKEQNSIESNWR